MKSKLHTGTWIIVSLPLIATLAYLAVFAPFAPPEPVPPAAKAGVLDLRGWDFEAGGNVRLDGEWLFESSRGSSYKKLPHLWAGDEAGAPGGKGFGSYSLELLLPEGAPRLGIRFVTTATSFAAYAGGVLFGSAGRPDPDPAKAVPAYKPQVAELPRAEGGRLTIRVDISNWDYRMGGMWRVPTLGAWKRLVNEKKSDDFSAFILYAFLLSIATVALIFWLLRRKEKAFILFSLFSAAMALRVLCTGEYLIGERFPGISFDLVVRLEYLTGFVSYPAVFLFFANLYPYLVSQRVKLLMIAPYGLLLAALPFLPLPILTWTIFAVYALVAPGIFFLFYLIAKKVIPRERIDGSVIMAGGICLALATINDIHFAAFIIYTGNILPLAFAFFVGIIGVLVAKRMLGSYEHAEILSAKLAVTNERLEEELVKSARALKDLEKSLDERELLIREIHHRVKNSLQIVASILSLQARRLPDQGMKQVFAAMKARIRAISLVHEKLYGLAATAGIGLKGYATDLVRLLDSVYAPPGKSIALELPVEDVEASVEFCVDLGLCLNELVSNAFKHGGPDASCAIRLSIEGDSLRAEVRDGGPGLPEGFEPSERGGLGLKILGTLTQKCGGSLEALQGGAAVILPLR
jgi:two-component sensor histidine kinase